MANGISDRMTSRGARGGEGRLTGGRHGCLLLQDVCDSSVHEPAGEALSEGGGFEMACRLGSRGSRAFIPSRKREDGEATNA